MNDSLLDKGQIVVVNDDPAKMNELAERLKKRGLTCAWSDPGCFAAIRIGFDDDAREKNGIVPTPKPLDTTKDRAGSRPIAAVVAASAVDDAWLDRILPAPRRKFWRGDYARLPDGTIVRVLGNCRKCDPARQTHVSVLLDGTLPQPGEQRAPHERLMPLDSLSPWTPRPGEFVMAMVDRPWCIGGCKAGDLLLVGPDANRAKTADGMSWRIAPDNNPGYLRPTSETGFPRPKVTLAWLERKDACVAGQEWFIDTFGKNAEVAHETVAAALAGKPDWRAWLEAHA